MRYIISIVATLCLLGISSCNNIEPAYDSPIAPKPRKAIRLMTYNVGAICKFIGDDFTKEDNIKLIAEIVKESQADAVAYQELDSCNTRNDYFQLEALAKATGEDWGYFYGPAIDYRGGKYGTGIAANRKKAIKSLYIPIPVKEGTEARVLTIVEYKDYVWASTHLNGGQPAQVEYLTSEVKKLYADSTKPVFLGGDMNANVGKEMMNKFCEDWTIISQTESGSTVLTTTKPCIDFILQLNNRAKSAEVIGSKVIKEAKAGDMKIASDHYPVYVDVVL